MSTELEDLCKTLDDLAVAILGVLTGDDATSTVSHWDGSPVIDSDLIELASRLAQDIRKANKDIQGEYLVYTNLLKVLWKGAYELKFGAANAGRYFAVYRSTLDYIRQGLNLVPDEHKQSEPPTANPLEAHTKEIKELVEKLVGRTVCRYPPESPKTVEGGETETVKQLLGRSKSLRRSMRAWVTGLVVTLAGTVWIIGIKEFPEPICTENWCAILKTLILLLGIGAIIWFVRVATKQISCHSRLAEDYEYKVTLVRVYEDYVDKAALISQETKVKLFESTIARVANESPLRLVDQETRESFW